MKGCDNCWQQCSLKHTPTVDSWWYTSHKNKQKLVGKRKSRVVHKNFIKLKKSRVEAESEIDLDIAESDGKQSDIKTDFEEVIVEEEK